MLITLRVIFFHHAERDEYVRSRAGSPDPSCNHGAGRVQEQLVRIGRGVLRQCDDDQVGPLARLQGADRSVKT